MYLRMHRTHTWSAAYLISLLNFVIVHPTSILWTWAQHRNEETSIKVSRNKIMNNSFIYILSRFMSCMWAELNICSMTRNAPIWIVLFFLFVYISQRGSDAIDIVFVYKDWLLLRIYYFLVLGIRLVLDLEPKFSARKGQLMTADCFND